jgi:hypothetical protein
MTQYKIYFSFFKSYETFDHQLDPLSHDKVSNSRIERVSPGSVLGICKKVTLFKFEQSDIIASINLRLNIFIPMFSPSKFKQPK